MTGASEPDNVSTKRQRIAELAKEAPTRAFTSLAHHIDLSWLHAALVRTRTDGAVGVDGQTSGDFNEDLGANLSQLLEQAKSGTHNVAGRTVPACLNLCIDEVGEMIAKGDGRILGHRCLHCRSTNIYHY